MCLLERAELNQDDIVSGMATAGAVIPTYQVFLGDFRRPVDRRGAVSILSAASRGLSMGNDKWTDSGLWCSSKDSMPFKSSE
jgi:hypothetical protein